ncbi:MAG: glycosyltransferase family 39 protein [Gemmatimonadetes bacterium]|nr:glycosyltransferase family 39 protein [Gemmatimonadota bacterium]
MRLFLGSLAIYAVLAVSTGEYLNEPDSYARLSAARVALDSPPFILDPWNKPVLTALAAGVLRLGGDEVVLKLVQAVLAAAALAITAAAARRAGARPENAFAAAALAGMAPFWVHGLVSLLTEISCALFLAAALWLWARERFALAALAVSFSFLARFEGVFFAAALAPFLLAKRSWAGLALLPLGPLLWNLAGWKATGIGPAFLLEKQPHEVVHATSDPVRVLLFGAMLVAAAGLLVLPALARVRRVPGPAPAIAAVTWTGHALLWTLGLMTSNGRPRYLVPMLPALAFMAAFGMERFGRRARVVLFAGATIAALFVAAYRKNTWEGLRELAREPRALTDEPTIAWYNGGGEKIDGWREAPPGTAIAWDVDEGPEGAFRDIPEERLRLERTITIPPRWPWQWTWEGRLYRLK